MGAGSLARRMASWPICLGDAGRREDRVYRPGRTSDVRWDEDRRQGVAIYGTLAADQACPH
jgi:hypothetical protein